MERPRTGKARITASERRLKALELRKLGLSYDRIGQQLGITRQAAHKAVKKALEKLGAECTESAQELRQIELERLNDWQLRVESEMKKGRVLPAIDRGLRIMARRAQLQSLESRPEVVATPEGNAFVVDEAHMKRLERLSDEQLHGLVFADDPSGMLARFERENREHA